MSTHARRTIWVTETKTALHNERALFLIQAGYNVIFLSDGDQLSQITEESRPTSVIIDTRTNPSETERLILTIAANPTLSAARFVLNATRHDEMAARHAMAGNFRDILPWQIATTAWIARFQYATAPRSLELPRDLCAVSLNQVAILRMPGRLVWINDTHMRIECRGAQRPGSTFHITGGLATAFGVSHIALTVESVHKDRLLYRFSQAIEARWSIPATHTDRAASLIRRLQLDSTGPRVRAFIAVNRADWRKAVVASLNAKQYEVNVALQRANLSSEAAYFSPDVVVFDDRVANNLKDTEITGLLTRIPEDVPLIVLGSQLDAARFKQLVGSRPFYQELSLEQADFANPVARYGIAPHAQLSAKGATVFDILGDHPWSTLELEVKARLQSISPKTGAVALPFSVGAFALARIESPLIRKAVGRDPYIKFTHESEGRHNPQFSYYAEFFLADIDQEERRKISHTLMNAVGDYYSKYYGYADHLPPAPVQNHFKIVQNIAPQPVAIEPLPSEQPEESIAEIKIDEKSSEPESLSPDTVNTKLRNGILRPEIEINFDIKKYIDPVIVKALAVFLLAITIMVLLLYAATNIDQDSYKDHGKEYGEFFKRMKDPNYKKSSP